MTSRQDKIDKKKELGGGTPGSAMLVPVDFTNAKPIYLQIVDHISLLARGGQLEAGALLPPSRILADQLQVHRSTVVNAYEELKARGVVEARQGSGSYISDGQRDTALDYRPVQPIAASKSEDVVAQLWRLNNAEGMISLALGLPADELVPVEEFDTLRRRVLRRDGAKATGYEDPQGYYPLRRAIASDLTRHGIVAEAEDIIITWGAQEGISLVARALATPGDFALMEVPAYFGTLSSIKHLGIHMQTFTLSDTGPEWNSLIGTLPENQQPPVLTKNGTVDTRPRFVCVVPDHQNPTGIRWSMPERYEFLRFANNADLMIVEDSTYRDLTFDGPPHLPLRALDSEVIYVGTFSKTLMPGQRIGYVLANGRLRDHLIMLKITTSGSGETLGQRTLAEYLISGRYAAHIKRIKAVYRARRDALLNALESFFPPFATWNQPSGGFHVWVTTPYTFPIERVFERALEHGIVIAPAAAFYPYQPQTNGFRLCFSRYPEDTLVHAVRDLGNILKSVGSRPL